MGYANEGVRTTLPRGRGGTGARQPPTGHGSTRTGRDHRIRLLLALVLSAAIAIPAVASAAPGDAAIAKATSLSHQWGRCSTARPAARLLAQAVATTADRPRARRARAALRAWNEVARECAIPVAMPSVTPGT